MCHWPIYRSNNQIYRKTFTKHLVVESESLERSRVFGWPTGPLVWKYTTELIWQFYSCLSWFVCVWLYMWIRHVVCTSVCLNEMSSWFGWMDMSIDLGFRNSCVNSLQEKTWTEASQQHWFLCNQTKCQGSMLQLHIYGSLNCTSPLTKLNQQKSA